MFSNVLASLNNASVPNCNANPNSAEALPNLFKLFSESTSVGVLLPMNFYEGIC